MTEEKARLMNPLQLAYVGDTVWELLIRTRLLYQGRNVRNMHQSAVANVNARAQAQALERLGGHLTEAEADIVRRGRNVHARHHAPRHQEAADYQAATALEALTGYLYVTGQEERLISLFQICFEEGISCPKST